MPVQAVQEPELIAWAITAPTGGKPAGDPAINSMGCSAVRTAVDSHWQVTLDPPIVPASRLFILLTIVQGVTDFAANCWSSINGPNQFIAAVTVCASGAADFGPSIDFTLMIEVYRLPELR